MTKPTEIISSTETVPVPPAITKEQIDAWKRQRAEQFSAALGALCNQYECDLIAVPQIADGRIVATIAVQPRG